ncbi:putative amidohydrolase [Lacibacter cauensis]|uniref:Omega-amidase YafV n=1 Tax=Lacibacter cauensis TaxID=510947 RepID=A0A562SK77_9BACT|nr:nitrilase family protein [Lacibacter cauensis]TWI81655.1 putative amidohydrolase [Lacibacter cauensis]
MSHLTFTLIQTNLHWEDKAANLQMLEEKINSLQHPTQIIVLPEMFNTGFSMQPELHAEDINGPTVQWMKRVAAAKRVIVTGSIMINQTAADGAIQYFNRLIWMLPNGQYGVYDKRHLFAYADEDKHYTAGTRRLIASVNGFKINLQVCYDLRFPVWARQQTGRISTSLDTPTQSFDSAQDLVPEYDILIYVANWPERRVHAWKTLLTARAIENQCYVIGVNRTGNDGNNIYHSGNSMVIDAMGEVLYEKEHDEDVFTITLSKEKLEEIRHKLPFLKDGDAFSIHP